MNTIRLAAFCLLTALAPTLVYAQKATNVKLEEQTKQTTGDGAGNKKESVEAEEQKRVQWIKDTIKFGIQKERREAINMILRIKTQACKEELYDLLLEILKEETNKDACVRILTVINEMKIKRGEAEVAARLDDESEDVVTAAVFALKSMEAVSFKDKLAAKLKEQKLSEDSKLTQALLSALGEFKAEELMPFVQEQLEGSDAASSVREQMTLFAGNIDTPQSKALLIKLYNNEEEELMIRCFAVRGLAKLGAKEHCADVNAALKTIDGYPFKKKQQYYNLVIYSVSALVKLGDETAVPRLMDSLKSDNASVRLRAVELIKETGDKRTIDILQYKMKHDSEAKVRKAAKEALESMGIDTEDSVSD